VHEVRDQAFQQHRVPGDGAWPDRLADGHVVLVSHPDAADQDRLDELVQLDRHPSLQAAVTTGEHEQALDQSFTAFVGEQQVLPEPAQLRGRGRIGHRDLDERALHRQRCAQLV
jgi:hypothetical protein